MKQSILLLSGYPSPEAAARATGNLPATLGEMGASPISLSTQSIPDDLSIVSRGMAPLLRLGSAEVRPSAVVQISALDGMQILREPTAARFPDLYRARGERLFETLQLALGETALSLPGTRAEIIRADSKLLMLSAAQRLGLDVPRWTSVGIRPDEVSGAVRKALGHAFAACRDRETGELVGVTVATMPADAAEGEPGPFLWQAAVVASAQVRCFLIGTNLHAAVWRREADSVVDLRDLQQSGAKIDWQPYALPEDLPAKLVRLAQRFGLAWCAPEFLVEPDGRHVLVDLNPVGEWGGFFPEKETRQITDAVARRILEPFA